MSVCLCECLACLCGCLQKLKRGVKSPETGVIGVVGHLIWVLGLKLGHLETSIDCWTIYAAPNKDLAKYIVLLMSLFSLAWVLN